MRLSDILVGDEVWVGISSRKVESINGSTIRLSGLESGYNARDLAPVFDYGEEIEVGRDQDEWVERRFISYQPKHNEPFIVKEMLSEYSSWKYARKIRKEDKKVKMVCRGQVFSIVEDFESLTECPICGENPKTKDCLCEWFVPYGRSTKS